MRRREDQDFIGQHHLQEWRTFETLDAQSAICMIRNLVKDLCAEWSDMHERQLNLVVEVSERVSWLFFISPTAVHLGASL
jgi:hypothetical protein